VVIIIQKGQGTGALKKINLEWEKDEEKEVIITRMPVPPK
jgi:hypothetical protein